MLYIVLLAGGKGTRMSEYSLPKPLLPIHNGKRVIDYVMDSLYWANNVAGLGIVLPNDEKAPLIMDYMDYRYKRQYHLMPVIQKYPYGTADALETFIDKYVCVINADDSLLVVYPDTIVSGFGINAMTSVNNNWVLTTKRTNPDGDSVFVKDATSIIGIGRNTEYNNNTYVAANMVFFRYVMAPYFYIDNMRDNSIPDIINRMLVDKDHFMPVFVDRMIDCGTPERYRLAMSNAEHNNGNVFGLGGV